MVLARRPSATFSTYNISGSRLLRRWSALVVWLAPLVQDLVNLAAHPSRSSLQGFQLKACAPHLSPGSSIRPLDFTSSSKSYHTFCRNRASDRGTQGQCAPITPSMLARTPLWSPSAAAQPPPSGFSPVWEAAKRWGVKPGEASSPVQPLLWSVRSTVSSDFRTAGPRPRA